MASMVLPQLDGYAENRRAKKNAHKKKKKKQNKKKQSSQGDSNAPSCSESPPSYKSTADDADAAQSRAPSSVDTLRLPLIVDGASWGKKHSQAQSQYAYGVNHPASHSYHDTSFVTQTSAAPLHSPSIAASTEETIRASSVQSGIPGDVSVSSSAPKKLPYCHVHGTATCRFDPECCVHKARADCDCPRRPSCCCVHHAGDCCTCVYTARSGYVNGAYSLIGHDLPSYAPHPVSKNGEVVSADPKHVSKNWPLKDNETSSKNVAENGIAKKHPETPTEFDDGPLAAYILRLYDSEEFHDCRILLKSGKDNFPPITIRTHKVLIARSPLLAAVLKSPAAKQDIPEIVAMAGENFLLVKAFGIALQSLYGLALLNQKRLRSMTLFSLGYTEESIKSSPYPINTALADFAMCYATSGAFLQRRDIVETGIKLIVEVINWDNIELIFYFGFCISKFLVTAPQIAELEKSSANQPATNNQATPNKVNDANDELLTKWAAHLLTAALDFVVSRMESDFALFPQAHCKGMPDRIPEYLDSSPTPSLPNPKLAEVKFGSFAALEEQKQSPEIVTTSAVLVCLPFEHLKEAFVKMNARGILSSSLAQAILRERERRRVQALRAFARLRAQSSEQEIPAEIIELGYREFFTSRNVFSDTAEDSSTASLEISLEREWIGLAVGEVVVKHRVIKMAKE
ncbi:hypothetical protein IFM58399_02280 [Aspergillus lentulus]|uniref:uncharacterized protein n=1 Tax=Aspergillus lentulus TaxID=293939 RepID=UPI0013958746|nr:uncharacterized protein IFM58399_02280 [Aspergillus lentulus]GFF29438.1 hypothetical protein IFM58399_02280 [Aspergillus lentulus]GFF49738.1 hypothetical protein IFM62136_01351 [Aspergillus lentulus]GFF71820.1 hypothetical protein IFM47457_02987 [Aspergillus lentulus]GFG02589.1 hypothetical protein IFM61392_02376 [Aspergillus lentulus]